MSRAVFIVRGRRVREQVCALAHSVPDGTLVEFRASVRTNEQNDKMWAMLTDVSRQHRHHGVKYSAEDWKLIFLAGLNKEMRLAPNLDGDGLVPLGVSSSRLTKGEMSDLIELIHAFAAKHGIVLGDENKEDAA